MRLIHPPAGSVQEHLALEDALLAGAEEVLSFWESSEPAVVLGRSCSPSEWVNIEACTAAGVPILRRNSGGGAVVLAPGCLNYSMVFSIGRRPAWRNVRRSLEDILRRIASAIGAEYQSPSDLAIHGRKISGCAQRRTAFAILHHGTLLYDFDPALAERYLREPPRQPLYRRRRTHRDFLSNLVLSPVEIMRRMAGAWDVREPFTASGP
ncbi:MAG: lipoate--protein ligase family protein [Bryobacterales bacterium]|nr:lipoate--protein ligase family protein [Bryobacterales bacterium]